MRTKRSAWIGLALALSLFVASAPSSGQSATPDPDPELATASIYAKDYNVGLDVANERLANELDFNEWLHELNESSVQVTGLIKHSEEQQSFIVFQADSAQIGKTQEATAGLPFAVEVRLANPIDTGALMDEIEPTVSKFFPTWAGMYYSAEQDAIIIEVSETDRDGKHVSIPDSLSSLVRVLHNEFDQVPTVKIEVVPEMLSLTGTARGGTAMSSCTAGFTAKKGSTIGFLTAAHCTGTQTLYVGTTTGTTSLGATTMNSSLFNGQTDIQYRTIGSSHTIAKSFYGSSSTTATTTVLPILNWAEGTTTCTRGKTSGVRCGPLNNFFKPNFTVADCGGQTCAATYLRIPRPTLGGDSGGPWYVGGRPLGIQKGGNASQSVASNIFIRPAGITVY